jgi:predicted nucleotidyltransferase
LVGASGCCGWSRPWIASCSVVEAEAILSGAVAAYHAALGERLVAAYALGSLAHGGFSALVSDIDLALILADPVQPSDGDAIRAIAESQKRAGSDLAERLSVFWGTPLTLRGQADGGRFPPVDRLDLIVNGRLLAGADACRELPRPTAEALLISGAEFALDFVAGLRAASAPTAAGLGSLRPASQEAIEELCEPELLLARGVRRVTKLVLFPVRFMFTAATGQVGTNADAVGWYVGADDAPCKPLVGAALAWREAPPEDDSTAVNLLREQLLPLYLQYIDDHIARLAAVGRPDLAGDFVEWRARLVEH